jgi:carbon-monoxide dehydrogenase small subunit
MCEKKMTLISMQINGKEISKEVQNNMLLVDFLREDLRLTGTHIGCDTSQCGACQVHLDGKAIKSCSIFVVELEGRDVVTIEGIAQKDGSLSVVQKAFQDHHGLQCGFCTPGMVMTAIDLLRQNKNPSESEIRKYLEGNICRCTGYHNIVKAIQAASNNLMETKEGERITSNVRF